MKFLSLCRTTLLALLVLPVIACAAESEEPARFQEGTHYQVLKEPVKTRDPSKIEVVELFWYGCSHCYSFEPLLQSWAKEVPADVNFWQSPAMWRDVMVVHAQAFYAAQQLGMLEKLHQPIFEALKNNPRGLANEQEVAALFAKYDVSSEAFQKAWGSFAVTSGVRMADARARNYQITGTPEMVVNGKYRTTTRMANGAAGMLEVVEFLIEKERKK